MLPEPCFSFTIPSILDDTTLECRVYNPPRSILDPEDGELWSPKAAIVAHPYAPLGGCYDDCVVLATVSEILKQGFVVGTFNFRGAGSSKGRTSWQARPETQDYVSFVGFVVHYVNGLQDPGSSNFFYKSPSTTLSPIQSEYETPLDEPDPTTQGMKLILGGYSYGSLIVTRLPAVNLILERFRSFKKGTAEAEIRLRAVGLSKQWNKDAQMHDQAAQGQSKLSRDKHHSMAVMIGGDETERGSQHSSHESRRSIEAVRRSMDRSRRKLGLRKHSSDASDHYILEESLATTSILSPSIHYLLISPLLPPISMFATMFSNVGSGQQLHWEDKLVNRPTLAIYGDRDFFTSQRKLRRWAEGLSIKVGSHFRFNEISGTGHFWQEDGAKIQLSSAICQWIQDTSQPIREGRRRI